MAAAQAAAAQGVEVALVDEQPRPGGQIYRNVDSSPLKRLDLLGKDYQFGSHQVRAFRQAAIEYIPETSVWYLDRSRQLGLLRLGVHRRIDAQSIVIASGAQERPMPIHGWQLPGVMSAGAGQILLKSAAMVPRKPPILAGSGPLLILLAWQYLRAGIGIGAIVALTISGAGANVPEFVVLTKLAQWRLIAVFFAYVFLVAMTGGLLAQLMIG